MRYFKMCVDFRAYLFFNKDIIFCSGKFMFSFMLINTRRFTDT